MTERVRKLGTNPLKHRINGHGKGAIAGDTSQEVSYLEDDDIGFRRRR